MNIIYNGTDITNAVHPTILQITDNAGGKPDSISIAFGDTDGLWSKWKPQKNDTLRVFESGFDSGLMYIDELSQYAGEFGIKALSIPQSSKSARSQGWESVRLLEIATEIAARYGFTLQTYNIVNHLYDRLDQHDTSDFAFFAGLCTLEGYALKINNRSMVIYNESTQERESVNTNVSIIGQGNMNGTFSFLNKSTDIYEKCVVVSNGAGYLEGSFSTPDILGPTIKRIIHSTNQAEVNRWARGVLRSFNKYMITGSLSVNLNTNYAAGTCIAIEDVGMFDGKYFIDRLTHDLINSKTTLALRKPLEGY